MPNVIKIGQKPELPRPWYEDTQLTCENCGTVFLLNGEDLDKGGGWVERPIRGPGVLHTVEGNCPICATPMLVHVDKARPHPLPDTHPTVTMHDLSQMQPSGIASDAEHQRKDAIPKGWYEGHRYLGDAGDDTT